MVQQLTRPSQAQPIELYPPSICGDKAIAANVLSWDRYQELGYYQPEDIERIEYKQDIVRYVLKSGGCIPLAISQYCWYWEQIQMQSEKDLPSVEKLTEMIDNVHFQHAWEDGWTFYNYCQETGNIWLTKEPESLYSCERTIKMTLAEVANKMIGVSEDPSSEEIVSLAQEIGTAIWEHGCKLGFILQYGNWFYAVTEVLAYGGFQYSHSRHGSFYLAQEELRERSWEVEEVA